MTEEQPDTPPKIVDYGVSVEEYLESMAAGIDILEVKRLESHGIPHDLAVESTVITKKIVSGEASLDEIIRGLYILTPKLRHLLD